MTQRQILLFATVWLASLSMMGSAAWYGLTFEVASPPTPQRKQSVEAEQVAMPDLHSPEQMRVISVRKFDPLLVRDETHSGPSRSKEIQDLRENWRLGGIALAETNRHWAPKQNADGTKTVELVEPTVYAVFFAGNDRFYREGDRLEGTEFTIKRIDIDQGYIEVEGDTGALVKLLLISDARYN